MGPNGSDVHDEGLFIPPVKLVDRGEVSDLLVRILKANSRSPESNEGDLYALVACCHAGGRRLLEMMREFGLSDLDTLGAWIIDTSGAAAWAAIAEVPNGVYRNEMRLDGYDFEIVLNAAMTVSDDAIVTDFAGSSSCSRHGINVPLNYAAAYSVFGIRCAVGPTIPNNAGSLAPFKVTAPEGCIVNAPFPAPVAMRHTIGQLMPDLVLGCLHQALPGRVPAEGASCMWDIPIRSAALSRLDGNATAFAVELTHNGGTGARPRADGLSATAWPSGVWGSQVEITEHTAPVRVRRRELIPDSGGAGRQRGGLGQIIELESGEGRPITLFTSVERTRHPARGRDGGADGRLGRISLRSGRSLTGKGEHVIPEGDRLVFETPGGGGYGSPLEREASEVVDSLLGCRPDIVLYGCTSATLARGPEFDVDFRRRIEEHAAVPAVTAASAVIEALRDLGVERFAFSSPYVSSLNDLAVSFIEAFGFRCVGRADAGAPLGNDDVAALTPEDVAALAGEADCAGAEAIVLSCTDMRAAEAVPAIEARRDKPVVTSNQAMMHTALKRLGISPDECALRRHRLAERGRAGRRSAPVGEREDVRPAPVACRQPD